jgi:uncharacterized membrane protein
VPTQLIDLVAYLFAEVLDGRNARVSDGVERALGRPARDFSDHVRKTAAKGSGMSDLSVALVIASAIGCGLVAGVFFAFSTFVMSALGRLPAAQGIAAMQQINLTVINPWFMGAFLGTAATCVAAAISVLIDWDGAYGPLVLTGGGLYLLGSIAPTSSYHQPRNPTLARLDPDGADAARRWDSYRVGWTALNHVRTIVRAIASGLLIAALQIH